MRLCIVTHRVTKGDGQGRVNYEVAWEAVNRGHQLILVATEVATELLEQDLVKHIPISVDGFPTAVIKEMVFSSKSAKWLRQNRDQFDVVKVNGAITSFESDMNAVHFVHSSWLNSPYHTFKVRRDLYGLYQFFYTALNSYWEKRSFQRANLIIAVSQKIAQELFTIGVSREKVRVIFNGVDLNEFYPDSTVDRSFLGLPQNVPLGLFVGDIQTARKNLDTILSALQKAPQLHLAIAGREENSPYPQLAKKLGVSSRTHFLGYRRDIPDLMKAVDFFVFPSRYEACTLVLLEAMASGLPVITAVTAGGAEIINGETGIVLQDPNDTDALAEGLIRLSENSNLRQEMGKTARMIAEEYSWQTVGMSYLDLLEKANY